MFLARQLSSAVSSGRRYPRRRGDRDDCDEEVDVDDDAHRDSAHRHRVSSNISAVSSYSTESSATDASVNSGKDYESDVFHQYSTGDEHSIDDPEIVLRSHLANAWFQKRAIMKSEPRLAVSSLYGGSILITDDDYRAGPVDVDELDEANFDALTSPQQLLESDEESASEGDSDATPPSSSSSDGDEAGLGNSEWTSYEAIRGRRHDAPNLSSMAVDSLIVSSTNAHLLYTHYNEYDRASIVSASTSDMTPVVCNTSPDASPSRQRPLKSGEPLDEIRESASDKRGWAIRDFCNYRTYQGKIALLLAVIFVLAIVTIVVSSTQVSQRSRMSNATSNTTDSGTSDVRRPTTPPSALRTTRPTAPSVLETGPSQSPPKSEAPPEEPVSAPTFAPTVAFEEVVWSQGATIEGPAQQSSAAEPAMFGSAVAISANANVLVVAARNAAVDGHDRAGLVQVFERGTQSNGSSAEWTLRATLAGRASQDGAGSAIAVSEDGSLLAMGEPGNDQGGDRFGSVRTFRYDAESREYAPLARELWGPGPASFFGASLALTGRRLVVGAPGASDASTRLTGMVQVYELTDDETEWRVLSTMFGTDESDWLGFAVDIAEDGQVVVASAPENSSKKGYVRVWNESAGQWRDFGDIANELRSSKSDERFGHSVSVTQVEGSNALYWLAIGSPFKSVSATKDKCGGVLVYEVSFLNDAMQVLLLGDEILGDEDDHAGYSLKLVQGRYLAVASPGANQRQGRVQLYRYHVDSMLWAKADQEFDGMDEGDNFGFSIAFARDSGTKLSLVVGATYSRASGAGYVTSFEPT
jgi:hypothetical protein